MSACERSEQVLAKRELSLAPQGAYFGRWGGRKNGACGNARERVSNMIELINS